MRRLCPFHQPRPRGRAPATMGLPTSRELAAVASALSFAVLLPAGASGQAGSNAADAGPRVVESELHTFRIVTVADGLDQPWSIAFLPGGDVLITEKPGRLRLVRDGALQPEPIPGTPAVRAEGQGGLLDVVPHPDFETNRLLYFSYAKASPDGSQGTTAVARARFDGARLSDLEEIFVAEAWSGGGAHFGSRLAFHPDGHLFITVGDRGANPLGGPREEHPAQDLSNHQGTVVRLHDDGRVPADNPFIGRPGARPEIWSYGHRNPQGLAIDQETGEVWVTEHGPQGGDELNRVQPGRNFGWPVVGYGRQYGGARIHEAIQRDGMEQPFYFWHPSIAASGLMLYTGSRFPEWRGHLFAGGLDGRQVARIPVAEGADGYQPGRLERPALLWGIGRVRDIRESPDGLVYIAIDGRRDNRRTPVLRLEPVE